jgi:hypothetical protein
VCVVLVRRQFVQLLEQRTGTFDSHIKIDRLVCRKARRRILSFSLRSSLSVVTLRVGRLSVVVQRYQSATLVDKTSLMHSR